jgi:hypothetical protein
MCPRVAKAQPWAGISERFQRYSSYVEFSHRLYREVVLTSRVRQFRNIWVDCFSTSKDSWQRVEAIFSRRFRIEASEENGSLIGVETMFYRRLISSVAAFCLVLTLALAATAKTNSVNLPNNGNNNQKSLPVTEPLNLAVLVQDDLISQVGNELGATSGFIRSLPAGSRVMVGYITTGTLQVRQSFTTDLDKAARSLRVPRSSTSASAFNPYVEVIEALRSFNADWKGKNAVLLISDGLDTSRGFDIMSSAHTLDLDRAIKQANDRNVSVYAFYAPAVGLTSRSRLAASYGQNSLNRLADDTGGKAFFQGTTGFVTFDSYFDHLRRTLNEQARAS